MSQLKFGRNYKLSVQSRNLILFDEFSLPYTIEFNITRTILGSINSCQIRIYNLEEQKRNDIRQDWSLFSIKRLVQLNAGYGDNLPLVFRGTIQQAYSYREGVNFITTIECQDGAFPAANSVIPPGGGNFPKNTLMKTIWTTLMSYLDNTTFGQIGDSFIKNTKGQIYAINRALALTGPVIPHLIELSGGAFFIDNGAAYLLNNEEFIKVNSIIPLISVDSGLLSTPLLEVKIVTFDMIFEPSLRVGQLIQLKSVSSTALNTAILNPNNKINNYYKIQSLRHRCMISPAVCGDAITNVEFFQINYNTATGSAS